MDGERSVALWDHLAHWLPRMGKTIRDARVTLLEKELDFQDAENELKDEEARLLLTGLAGKNAEERAANLRVATEILRNAVSISVRERAAARVELEYLQDEFTALNSLARICEPLTKAS